MLRNNNTYTALRRQPSTKEGERWKDVPFYTTIDLTTRFWMLPKDSRAYRYTLENSRTPESTTYQTHTHTNLKVDRKNKLVSNTSKSQSESHPRRRTNFTKRTLTRTPDSNRSTFINGRSLYIVKLSWGMFGEIRSWGNVRFRLKHCDTTTSVI